VAGTHGKTTTSALLSHLLTELKSDPSYLVGGIMQGQENNYHIGQGSYFVVEGDEYDTAFFDKGPKFLHYQPYYTLITSLEFDHADIYRDLTHLTESFVALLDKTNPSGFVLACDHYSRLVQILPQSRSKVETYGLENFPRAVPADWLASNLHFETKHTACDITYKGKHEAHLLVPMAGKHNILNTLACFALLRHLGFESREITQAFLTFSGVKRRQEVRGIVNERIVIDDFAHHPTAVLETIDAIKRKYPSYEIWAVFEPRSNTSKRNIFQNDYVDAFLGADHVLLSNVFMPEKITTGSPLDVALLAADITHRGVPAQHLNSVDRIVSCLADNVPPRSVILIMSNGGFGGIHEKVLLSLKNRP